MTTWPTSFQLIPINKQLYARYGIFQWPDQYADLIAVSVGVWYKNVIARLIQFATWTAFLVFCYRQPKRRNAANDEE